MEITVTRERIFRLHPHVDWTTAKVRVEDKRVNLVAGTMGALFSRPKPEDIRLIYSERRLEPIWHIGVHTRTVYDRQASYTVPITGAEVKRVTILGQTLSVQPKGPSVVLQAMEHCEEELQKNWAYGGDGVARTELVPLLAGAKDEIEDLNALAAEGIIVVPPEVRANSLIRQIVSQVVKPVKAQVIHEERVDIDMVDLYFRPVYAFEFEWAAKSKQVVVEFDGITGEMRTGKAFKDQLRSVLNPALMFDLGADAVDLVVPGAGIAMKLVRAVVDRKK
ncbi:MAG: hypothetical protein ACOY94_09215 [Bacillota bacterium]